MPTPVSIVGGNTTLPTGVTGFTCDYHSTSDNVIIEVLMNVDPSFMGQFTMHFPVPPQNVSGVGDQARSFDAPLGGGKDNEGVVATKGSTLVSIGATDTPATLSQIEALVNQLL